MTMDCMPIRYRDFWYSGWSPNQKPSLCPYLEGNSNNRHLPVQMSEVLWARAYSKYFWLRPWLFVWEQYPQPCQQVERNYCHRGCKRPEVILIDDIVDTAGTFRKSSKALIDKGCKNQIHLYSYGSIWQSHRNNRSFQNWWMIVTDFIPLKNKVQKSKSWSSAKLFAKAIRNTACEHRSIGGVVCR